jgi:hypothetical protein
MAHSGLRTVGCYHHHLADGFHQPYENPEAFGCDAIIVGDKYQGFFHEYFNVDKKLKSRSGAEQRIVISC